MKKRIFALLSSSLVAILFFASCAAPKIKNVDIVLPPPPEEPKIFYVGTYKGESSFKETSFLDSFIGEVTGGADADLYKPYGVSTFQNLIYVTDTAIRAVFAINPKADKKKKEKNVILLGDKAPGQLSLPAGVANDKEGNLYVADTKAKKVFGYDKSGNMILALGKEDEFVRPAGLAINNELERMYIVDTKAHDVKAYSLKGEALFTFGKRGIGDGEFNFPTNVAVDQRNGNVIIVDTQNFRYQVFDKDGKFISKMGSAGDKPGNFSRPKGVGIDSDGHIYVADSAFNNVQIFDDKGNVLLYFGGAGQQEGQFTLISGIHVDENDRIYIVDSFNARVQMFQYVSENWKSKFPEEYKELKDKDYYK